MPQSIVSKLKDKISGKVPAGKQRSDKWPEVRKQHLEKWPYCAACHGDKNLEVHHIKPFHVKPKLELDPANLITLCESKDNGVNCHLLFGHLGNFRSVNVNSVNDAKRWRTKLMTRPTLKTAE